MFYNNILNVIHVYVSYYILLPIRSVAEPLIAYYEKAAFGFAK
jgi:hypothetical protein